MRKTIILLWLVLLPPGVFAQQVDTLWSVPQLDGGIDYRPGSGIFTLGTNAPEMIPGDAFDVILGEEVFTREYLSFDLNQLSNPDTSAIVSATIGVYQLAAFGNEQLNTYPIWNVAGGDTHFCVLDHIDYGSSLDLEDWTAGDPGDPQTLQTNIGIISDNAVVEYKTMDVTRYVKEDIANGRNYNQYRMRFTIDTDFDGLADFLQFRSGNSIVTKPYLVILYDNSNAITSHPKVLPNFRLKQNYPNPFNPTTTIKYQLPKATDVRLEIYNILGQKVKTLVDKQQAPDYYTIKWDGRNNQGNQVAIGLYIYRLSAKALDGSENFVRVKKMLLIR